MAKINLPIVVNMDVHKVIAKLKEEGWMPVVRCEDCKHAQHDEIFGQWWCRGREVTPDWFCKDGEKKK